jgi:serine/threonine protein kinase
VDADAVVSSRFEVVRRIGQGGMGVVYEVYDRERGARVALKTIRTAIPNALWRFKREFRSLADLDHPNLVRLLELVVEGDRWCFTMELVDGVDLLAWVRREGALRSQTTVSTRSATASATVENTPGTPTVADSRPPTRQIRVGDGGPTEGLGETAVDPLAAMHAAAMQSAAAEPRPITVPPYDETRLRAALGQLTDGLMALHGAGKVHRDIKPSNVRVTPEGRVVLLDFGLVADLADASDAEDRANVVGTIDFMAPEQAAGGSVGPPADWYAVGVILFFVLTGQLPFRGEPRAVFLRKQALDAPTVQSLAPDAPADLAALADALLKRDPTLRPRGPEIAEALQAGAATPPADRTTTTGSQPRAPFVGRRRELQLLDAVWFDARKSASAAMVLVEGESGVGKSALVRWFAQRLADREPELVFVAGRYFEHEEVPYRAFDAILDGLVRYLEQLPSKQAEALIPPEAPLVAQLFPVLRSLPGLDAARGASEAARLDPRTLRSRVFTGVRGLVTAIARTWPLLVTIDDVQWADADSRALFAQVMAPPAPPVVVLATMRTPAGDDAAAARALLWMKKTGPVRHLRLGPFGPEDGRALVDALLGREVEPAVADALVEEAGGHPLFIDALCRHRALGGPKSAAPPRLEDAIAGRADALPNHARELLTLLSLADGPIVEEVARRALGVEVIELARATFALKAAHLVRPARERNQDALEPFHDRVRQAVRGRLDDETQRSGHERLARALEAIGWPDAEALYTHWRLANDPRRAAHHAAIAAEHAAEVLAFDHAAALYAEALALEPDGDPVEQHRLRVCRAEALANAGRGPEAAAAFAAAVPGAPAGEALDLRRRAAEQLLRSGRIDEGLDAVRVVLRASGFSMPGSPRAALLAFLFRRAQLRLRGLGFVERDASQIPDEQLMRVDSSWSIAGVLGMVDTIRGAYFQTLHLLLALRAGEPFRVARALTTEAAFSAIGGVASAGETAAVLGEAQRLAERLRAPYLLGWTRGIAGVVAGLEGRFADALPLCEEGEAILREQCTGTAWELSSISLFRVWSMAYIGNLDVLGRAVEEGAKSAVERGDLYGAAIMRSGLSTMVALAADRPAYARAGIGETMKGWSRAGFFVEHFWELIAEAQVDLYLGDPAAAWERIAARWGPLDASMLLRVQLSRIEAWQLRGRVAAALAATVKEPAQRKKLVARARADARSIAAERTPWGAPLALLIDAAMEAIDGRTNAAVAKLVDAEVRFGEQRIGLYAAAAQRRRGELLGGEEGRAVVAAADEDMRSRGVRDPDRFAAVLAPGFPDRQKRAD